MEKILLVEDDRDIAELERDYLELNGFAVDMEMNGRKGLEKQQKRYDKERHHGSSTQAVTWF